MPLSAGTRLGPYEIVAPIGAGGMGEVYRARDTRLDRTVAIKVSKEKFSERFEREARAVAALNHPGICTLHDVGPDYLVMEYIEGQPIKGPMPLDQALQYAVQICDALDAAHRSGITHRDLKPDNILVTRAGVKLLDFGLAKLVPVVSADDATMTRPLTGTGQILGTLQYMSPEQLQGHEAGPRSDIFSFGLVLYEMLTGKRAFEGANAASTMGAILEREAPSLAAVAPAALDRTVHRCLEKDPENRWQSARDLKAELEWIAAADVIASPRSIPRRSLLPWIAVATGVAGGAGLAAWAFRGQIAPARKAIRFRLVPPEGALRERTFTRQALALSPAGDSVAMIAKIDRRPMVWVHRLDSLMAGPLQGTEGATGVFWSPDGQFIGFWANGKLMKIPAGGGTPLPICDLPSVWSATWSRNGIIIAESGRGVSCKIDVRTGTISPGKPLMWPKFLPGGTHLLYVNFDRRIGGYRAYAAELSTGRETELMPTHSYVTFVPDARSSLGHLLFIRSGTLMAIGFDADRLRVYGDPRPVAKDVPFFSARAGSEFDASDDGVLIYPTGSQKSQLTWLDRSGRESGTVGDPQEFWQAFRISPDGRKLIADVADLSAGGSDIWEFDLTQGTTERVTFEPGSESWPVWSPDGKRIAYASAQGGPPQVTVKTVGDRGAGEGVEPGPFQLPIDWSADGRWILFQTANMGGDGNPGIWLASLANRKNVPLVRGESGFPALSSDGHFLAYSTTESGRSEVYVQRFDGGDPPGLTGRRQRVSREGGDVPRWRRDGKELFFFSPDPGRRLMAVPLSQGKSSELEFGTPVGLFRVPVSTLAAGNAGYEPSPDGKRFLLPVGRAMAAPLEVVVNWQEGLKG